MGNKEDVERELANLCCAKFPNDNAQMISFWVRDM